MSDDPNDVGPLILIHPDGRRAELAFDGDDTNWSVIDPAGETADIGRIPGDMMDEKAEEFYEAGFLVDIDEEDDLTDEDEDEI